MITEIRKGFNVKRFHTSNRIQAETNGHHSANVCAIILRIDPNCSRDVLIAALMHDVPEAYTGDVPAPFKWENPDAKHALEVGEMDYVDKHSIPHPHLTDGQMQLLKFADMMDLVLSSLEEMGRGNNYARELVTNGARYLQEGGYPLEWIRIADKMVDEVKAEWDIRSK